MGLDKQIKRCHVVIKHIFMPYIKCACKFKTNGKCVKTSLLRHIPIEMQQYSERAECLRLSRGMGYSQQFLRLDSTV